MVLCVLVLENMHVAADGKRWKTCANLEGSSGAATFCKITHNYGQILEIREDCYVSFCGRGFVRKGAFTKCDAILRRWRKINGAPTYRKGCKKDGKRFCEFKVMNSEDSSVAMALDVKLCVKGKSRDYEIMLRGSNGIEFFMG